MTQVSKWTTHISLPGSGDALRRLKVLPFKDGALWTTHIHPAKQGLLLLAVVANAAFGCWISC